MSEDYNKLKAQFDAISSQKKDKLLQPFKDKIDSLRSQIEEERKKNAQMREVLGKLTRYNPYSNAGHDNIDVWVSIEEEIDGEYVKWEDVEQALSILDKGER